MRAGWRCICARARSSSAGPRCPTRPRWDARWRRAAQLAAPLPAAAGAADIEEAAAPDRRRLPGARSRAGPGRRTRCSTRSTPNRSGAACARSCAARPKARRPRRAWPGCCRRRDCRCRCSPNSRRRARRARSPCACSCSAIAHAEALVALTAQARVDLLEVELALARVLAERLRRVAERGDAALRDMHPRRASIS